MNEMIALLKFAAAQGAGPGGLTWTFLIPMAVMFFIIYFLILNPQKKKQREVQKMLADMKKGDRAVTIGGIHGIIKSLSEKEVVLTVDDANKTKIAFSRDAIARVQKSEEAEENE